MGCRALLDQIHHQLKNQNGIQTIALIGPGGAGKTTLARQYAHQQQGVVWEINAETEENLKESFWKLANALLTTEKDKDKLQEIEDIKDLSEKEEKLIQLVKEGLKAHPHWTLIYDNVESLTDIHKFFPVDFKTWGMGKVIVTTRNSHIQNSNLISRIVQIGELNQDQKLALFIKIMEKSNKPLAKNMNIGEISQFLEKIPSYPLDISMTAYYLKTNDITFNEYLELLHEHKSAFVNSQENLLKEAGDYLNTRYGIISLSLKQLINKHPDYVTPLLLISLLDSQNIPREVLNTCKNTTDVKNFMYELKKYFLLTNESTSSSPFDFTFSLHRSTQAIILAYFLKILGIEGIKTRIQLLANGFGQLAEEELEKENTLHIKTLLNHFRAFLSHDQLLSPSTKSSLTFELGRMYDHLNQYEKAKELLEQSLQILTEQNKEKGIKFARVSSYLGSIYKELSNPQRSQELLEKSLLIYNENPKENQREIAHTLAYLGNTYRNIGNFIKAKSTLEESVHIYKQQTPIQHSGLAFALVNLGATQRDLKNTKDAIHSLEESLSLYREYTPGNFMGIARALYYLGSAYYSSGDFKKAQSTLEESINLLKKHSYKNNILTGRIYIYLGNVYQELGEYKKAKDVLEKAFSIHKTHHTKEHFEYAWPLLHIGFVERELGEPQKAKVILEECLEVYKKHFDEKHSNIAWIFAELAKVHNDLHNYDTALKLLEKSIPIHEESYGKDHPTTARALNVLAQTYLLKGDLKSAEPYLQKILTVFQEKKDPDVYKVCEDLADLELKKAHNEDSQRNKERAEAHKMQAISYLTQALEVTKATFPESSPHFIRIQAKLKNLK